MVLEEIEWNIGVERRKFKETYCNIKEPKIQNISYKFRAGGGGAMTTRAPLAFTLNQWMTTEWERAKSGRSL